ncbi:MAG: LD-carboxypeptidase [Defluviitaleaceae bacterium]|nr:LD-carboxypeptidase [Defluviitaleaceae bacterium]
MKQLPHPKSLTVGQKAAVIAPSSPVTSKHLIHFAISYLKTIGIVPVLGESCNMKNGYLSGSDDARAKDVNWAFSDENISAVFCLRGGYGVQRILDKVNFEVMRKNPKPLFGYSDITALHTAINQNAGFITYHTPMLGTQNFMTANEYTLRCFHHFIFNPSPKSYQNPIEQPWRFLNKGMGVGQLCGGNLSIIASSLGTPFEINTTGKILFIEEIGEEPYKIDRMLNHLRLAGKLDACAGMIFGSFTNCEPKEYEQSQTIPEIINDLGLDIPILYNFACGHTFPTASLPMGAMARLDSFAGTFEVLQ